MVDVGVVVVMALRLWWWLVVMVGVVGGAATVARVTDIWEEYEPVWLLVSKAAMVA